MNAQFVVSAVCLALTVVSVCSALASWRHSKAATKRLSTTSLRVELDEIQDAIGRHSALLKRINARSVMAERRAEQSTDSEPSSAPRPGESSADFKRRMRIALIHPGQPVKHG